MIENEIYIINNKKIEANVLTYYDGVLESVNVESNTIFMQYEDEEYDENNKTPVDERYDTWIEIKTTRELLAKYLKGNYDLYLLAKQSTLNIYKRFYSKFSEFIFQRKLPATQINLSKSITLGYDYSALLNEKEQL